MLFETPEFGWFFFLRQIAHRNIVTRVRVLFDFTGKSQNDSHRIRYVVIVIRLMLLLLVFMVLH